MIYYATPYSLEKNLGVAYNEFMRLLPNPDDFGCLVDADAMFTTTDYGHLIAKVVEENPNCRLFYALTNRIGCGWQRAGPETDTDDLVIHREYGLKRQLEYGTQVINRRNAIAPSGFFMLLRRDLWEAVGGFPTKGMLGVDNVLFLKAIRHEEQILQMQGLYLYHWYKGSNPRAASLDYAERDTSHLK